MRYTLINTSSFWLTPVQIEYGGTKNVLGSDPFFFLLLILKSVNNTFFYLNKCRMKHKEELKGE